MLAASLIIFLYAYLNLNRWNIHYSHLALTTLILILGLLGVAVWDPSIAAGIARLSLGRHRRLLGFVTIAVLAFQHYDRAILLIPTWCLLIAWLVGAAMTVTGYLSNDIVQPALGGGLVLIVLLIGFTVMQHAFAGGAIAQGLISDIERKALALTGAGDIIWDWDIDRDRIYTGNEVEDTAQPQTGHAGRACARLAGQSASAGPGPVPRDARCGDRPAPRQGHADLPPQRPKTATSAGSACGPGRSSGPTARSSAVSARCWT